MGCIRITPRPFHYHELARQKAPEKPVLDDKITICSKIKGLTCWRETEKQSAIRKVIQSVFRDPGVYHRQYNNPDDLGYYTWKALRLHQTMLTIGPIDVKTLYGYEPMFNALAVKGWQPNGEILITYFPKDGDVALLYNLVTIINSRQSLIEKALELMEPLTTIITDGLALGISLGAFSYPRIEAAAYLMAQACRMAQNTGRARMKPCDMSNPRFQMRSWLLRLGFIGDAYERPRRTLMAALDGDSAFFTNEQKYSAMVKRKRNPGG